MALGETEIARRSQQRLGGSARKRTIAIGVDRLDYSKGLPERIDALERLFSSHEDMVNQLLFVQIAPPRSEEHTYELQSLMRITYAVFCLKNKKKVIKIHSYATNTKK